MMETLQFFWRHPLLVTALVNVKNNMTGNNYDFPFVICGDVGSGKSMLLLHIFELWYKVILKKDVTEEDIEKIMAKRVEWLKKFNELEPYEMNPNDEGADGLMSKEAILKFGRTIEKVYNVNRKMKILSPIVIPDFFSLPPYFRSRVRACIHVDRRGHYRFFTKKGLMFLNAFNANKKIKSMMLAFPAFKGVFPDYQGVLRKPYDLKSIQSAKEILEEAIKDNTGKTKSKGMAETFCEPVGKLLDKGYKTEDIMKKLAISSGTVSRAKTLYYERKLE